MRKISVTLYFFLFLSVVQEEMSFKDLDLSITNLVLSKIYDKRDDFNFESKFPIS